MHFLSPPQIAPQGDKPIPKLWYFNQNANAKIFFCENAFENVICKSQPFCLGLNSLRPSDAYMRL